MFAVEALQQRIAESELGREWVNQPLINQDIWLLTDLGYSEEECQISRQHNIYFNGFSLFWLKLLVKLTTLASVREKHSLGRVILRIHCLKHLDEFLISRNVNQPSLLTDALLQEFIFQKSRKNRQSVITYAVKLWKEEQWVNLPYVPRKMKQDNPKIETISEEVLYQIYQKFDLFPPPLERLFRLQLVLGCRIGELLRMPRHSLKKENNQWFLLRWVEKRKHWHFYQIHPVVAELVQEQQRFLDTELGINSSFDKLFCKVSTGHFSGAKKRFDSELLYFPEILPYGTIAVWVQDFREEANLRDKYGKRFKLTTHMFRRTKASIMAHCETEDEYIAAVLGHGSLDMLPHYRKRSLERLEKEADTKGYVDMYGKVTSFKPRKRRYETLAELLKVNTSLGECHRPSMLGDCQYRYACLSCSYHRVTLEDKSQLKADCERLLIDLEQAKNSGLSRRITEINRLLELLQNRLQGLVELTMIKENKTNG